MEHLNEKWFQSVSQFTSMAGPIFDNSLKNLFDGDGDVDIIVGNFQQNNQLLLNNGYGSYSDLPITLPGGTMNTTSVTVADVDGDGDVDIIVGNVRQNNQLLLNDGDGSYSEEVMDLPGGARITWSVAAADVDGDGMVDIIIGNSLVKCLRK